MANAEKSCFFGKNCSENVYVYDKNSRLGVLW